MTVGPLISSCWKPNVFLLLAALSHGHLEDNEGQSDGDCQVYEQGQHIEIQGIG